jgi:hypothetical protein
MLRLKRMCRVSVSRDFNSIQKVVTLVALLLVLALALPVFASAQLLDPTLDQYAPSTQQIDKQVNGGGGGSDGDGGGGSVSPGGGGGQVSPAGGGGQASSGGDGGDASSGGGGGEVHQGGSSAGTPARAEGGGLDGRVVGGVPFTGFDLVALALAAAVIAGTAVLLRRLSRRPEPRT